jgi:hypothetical protein
LPLLCHRHIILILISAEQGLEQKVTKIKREKRGLAFDRGKFNSLFLILRV